MVAALSELLARLSGDIAVAIQRLASRVVAHEWEAAQWERGTKSHRVVRLLRVEVQTHGKEQHMSTLVVIGYNDRHQAEEVRLKLRKLQRDYLIDLEDAVVATKDAEGKIKLHQAVNLTAAGAVSGGFWGSLIGLIFLNPLLGLAVGAAAGAVSGALTDVGIDDTFMKELAATMQPGSSVLFVLVSKATPDKVLEEIQGTGGKILRTSLSHEDEAKLQAALSAAKQAG
jgi:uncharacterized membrane protein